MGKCINFEEIEPIAPFLNFIQVAQFNLNIMPTPREKSTLYYCYHDDMMGCLLVIGEKHGFHDMQYFIQEIKTYSERHCCCFVLIDAGLDKNSFAYFKISDRHSIIVDSNVTLIKLETFFNGGKDVEQQAKELTSVAHYTDVDSAVGILTSHSFLAKSLNRYKTEKEFSFNENSRRLAFISCFTKDAVNNTQLWVNKNFGNNHKGCKIDLFFKHSLCAAFNSVSPLKCFDEAKNEYYISTLLGDKRSSFPGVCFRMHYKDIDYEKEHGNNVNLQIYDKGLKDFTIVDTLAKSVLDKFSYQNEMRIVLILEATQPVEIPFIQTVEIPYNIEEIERIAITAGRNVSPAGQEKLAKLKDCCPLVELLSEDIHTS